MTFVKRGPCADCGAVLFTGVDAWYRSYAPRLRRLVGRFATDRGVPQSALDPEDVVHEVFELLQTRLSGVHQPAAWLRRVAERHVARAHGELRHAAGSDLEEQLAGALAERYWSSLARSADLDTIVEYRAVLTAIAALPDRQRAAVYLQRIEGMSHREIAERLGIAVATVGVHAHRGIRSVREMLGDELDRQAAVAAMMLANHLAMAPRWTEWTWCPCWHGLPKERSYVDELLERLREEFARERGPGTNVRNSHASDDLGLGMSSLSRASMAADQ